MGCVVKQRWFIICKIFVVFFFVCIVGSGGCEEDGVVLVIALDCFRHSLILLSKVKRVGKWEGVLSILKGTLCFHPGAS